MKPFAYYNENDPFAAAWLRELMKAQVIADGEIDTRSIVDVQPTDLLGFRQCHFFAGIGGWSYALRLAGWPDDQDVWTGSCPCQPFSSAGSQTGGDDPRHLWPTWFCLIRECRPVVVFGEQVEAAITHGWLDLVCDDLEREGYAVGSAGLPATSVGAFHRRQRLWFVADAGHGAGRRGVAGVDSAARREGTENDLPIGCGGERNLADADGAGQSADSGRLRDERHDAGRRGVAMVNTEGGRREGQPVSADGNATHGITETGFWDSAIWIPCADGKARPIEPSIEPLAYGIPARVGRLRGYGNAIVPQVAAAFISAARDAIDDVA